MQRQRGDDNRRQRNPQKRQRQQQRQQQQQGEEEEEDEEDGEEVEELVRGVLHEPVLVGVENSGVILSASTKIVDGQVRRVVKWGRGPLR